MTQGASKQEAIDQWDKWKAIVDQIKNLERVITQFDELSEPYSPHLAELRSAEVVARKQLECVLRSIYE